MATLPFEYIVDASVVVQELVADSYTQNVRSLFILADRPYALCTTEFCILECTNVLWKQVRFRGMSDEHALALLQDLIDLPLRPLPTQAVLKRSLEIGLLHRLAVYDSIYIALAEQLQIPLITVDARQQEAARAIGVTIKPITDFPPLP